jgi:hypothetical protein
MLRRSYREVMEGKVGSLLLIFYGTTSSFKFQISKNIYFFVYI